MVDMNSQLYRCCGFELEIQGSSSTSKSGVKGYQVFCELCKDSFFVEGTRKDAWTAIPDHFKNVHDLDGIVEDWHL